MRRCATGGRASGGGFTLVEMLVALLILSIMSAMGYGIYRQARIGAERAGDSLKRTREIEFGMRIMVQDFSQAVPRPVRDPLGETRQPALRGGIGATTLVDLTRGGWSNTAGLQRTTLQRVSYQLNKGVVQRSYFTVLDATANSQPVIQDLLTDVNSIQVNYLDPNHNWVQQWPPPALPPNEALATRPVAVEIIIDFKDWGKVRRLVEVAG
ncbi:MAG: type II secretion system minor pseudopilin GspJ [Steroidobacterales bacterium]